uniref:Uncharacterized protein n=1 Tax=Setaria italica TaxID=4555 RepID=K3XP92_SETIT
MHLYECLHPVAPPITQVTNNHSSKSPNLNEPVKSRKYCNVFKQIIQFSRTS